MGAPAWPEAQGREPVVRAARRSSRRSLAPREHGAYGQLALPLFVAHATGGWSIAAWLFTVAAVAALLAHEPLLIALGKRGSVGRGRESARARRALALAVSMAAVAGGLALVQAPGSARWAAAGCGGLALLVGGAILAGVERSVLGELLVAATLSALALPVALSAGATLRDAVSAWVVWVLGFAAATLAVRETIAQPKSPRSAVWRIAAVGSPIAIGLFAGASGAMGYPRLAAAVPLLLVSLAVAARPPHPRHLRRVGWVLVAATVATAAGIVVAPASGQPHPSWHQRGASEPVHSRIVDLPHAPSATLVRVR